MAAMWHTEKDADKVEQDCYVIVTRGAQDDISWLHSRMPLMFESQEEIDLWCDNEAPMDKIKELIKPVHRSLAW